LRESRGSILLVQTFEFDRQMFFSLIEFHR
jgi:hypothetical protein